MVGVPDCGVSCIGIEYSVFYQTISKKDKTFGISRVGLDFSDVGSYVIIEKVCLVKWADKMERQVCYG